MEMFGGHVNMKHFVAVGAEDDSVDADSGVQANLEFVLAVQRNGVGDKALENDSPADDHGPGTTIPDALPRTLTQISNFTFWATGGGEAIQARGAGDINLSNGVIYKPAASGKECINDHGEVANGTPAQVAFYSLELDCTDGTFTQTAIGNGNGASNKFQTNTLVDNYLDGDNEMNFTPIYDAKQLSTQFSTVTYVGAVPSGGTPWTRGWTCDSTTVSFGSGLSCKSLPVFN
jgi:hypothetical protein